MIKYLLTELGQAKWKTVLRFSPHLIHVCPSDLKETIFPLVSAPRSPLQTLRVLNGKCDVARRREYHFSKQAHNIFTSSILRRRLQKVLNVSSRCSDSKTYRDHYFMKEIQKSLIQDFRRLAKNLKQHTELQDP